MVSSMRSRDGLDAPAPLPAAPAAATPA
jgi:hypothetical protein